MKKKLLEKLPMKTMKLTKKNKKWVASAEIIMIDENELLMVDFYKNLSVDNIEEQPSLRMFLNHKEDYVYDPKENTWCQKKIENLIDMGYYGSINGCNYELADNESEKIIQEFIPSSWDREWAGRIGHLQYENRSAKATRAYSLRVDRVHKAMDEINDIELPEDFKEFIDSSFLDKRYVFYKSDKNRKHFKLFCAHCKAEILIDRTTVAKPEHKQPGICSSCGSRITYIAPGYKERCTDNKEYIVMQKRSDGFVSRYFEILKTSSQSGEVYQIMEKARVVYDGKKARTYYNTSGSYSADRATWWDSNAGMYSYDYHVSFGKGILYHKNLDEVLKGTTFQYCALRQLAEHRPGYMISHDAFLQHFEGSRFIEYFIKMGLYNLANDYVEHYWSDKINRQGKSMLEILKISKQQVNRLIEMNGDIYTLELLQAEETSGTRFTDDQIAFFTEYHLRMDHVESILQYTTPTQAVRFLRVRRDYKSMNQVLTEWNDYVENCKLLGYDIENEFVLFPNHLKLAHDSAARAAVDLINRDKDRLLQERMNAIRDQYSFESKSFVIRIPNTTGEIIREGQDLHHCVGTYVERVVRGECIILFVRRKEDTETSFFTMEVKENKIVQCRGKNNCDMPQPVKQFVESFEKKKFNLDQSFGKDESNVA